MRVAGEVGSQGLPPGPNREGTADRPFTLMDNYSILKLAENLKTTTRK